MLWMLRQAVQRPRQHRRCGLRTGDINVVAARKSAGSGRHVLVMNAEQQLLT